MSKQLLQRVSYLVIFLFSQVAHAENMKSEKFIVSAPDGFVVGADMSKDKNTFIEYIKKGQTVEDWTDMITVQTFSSASVSPAQFLQGLGARVVSACPGTVSKRQINTGTTNGYTVSMLDLWCPNNPGTKRPETMLIRMIKGESTLYSVQYAWRTIPGDDQLNFAAKFLGSVSVCDSQSKDHPC